MQARVPTGEKEAYTASGAELKSSPYQSSVLYFKEGSVKDGKVSSKPALRIYFDSVNEGVIICSKIC